jgi:hypothetical protein
VVLSIGFLMAVEAFIHHERAVQIFRLDQRVVTIDGSAAFAFDLDRASRWAVLAKRLDDRKQRKNRCRHRGDSL